MPETSRRAQTLGTENAFVVLAEVDELRRRGRAIISFCIGQPDFPTPEHIKDAAIRALRENKTGYTPSAGIPELRAAAAAAMSAARGVAIRPEDVVVGAGAKPFIRYVIETVTDAGEGHEVVFPVPGFPIYESMIRTADAVPVPLALEESRGFAFDPDAFARAITPKTRLVILNTPQNPTGGILDRPTLQAIAETLRRHEQVWIYADEIYSRLVYDGAFASIASEPDMLRRTIIADGASKTWSMTGWRIGWAANAALAPILSRWVTNTESCAGHMNQWGALAAITGPQDDADKMKAEFHARRDLVVKLLNDVPGMRCATPGGAFYAWPNVTEACRMVGAKDSEELRRRLLHEAEVAVLADQHFGPRLTPEQHIRLSYAASREALEQGVGRIAEWVRKNTR